LCKTHSLARRAHFIREYPIPSRQGQRPRSSHLALGAENGTLRPVDPEIAATALYGAVTVIGLRSLVIDNHLDVDEVSGQILPLFWSGIRPNTRS
jgi:hypothetical protein